MAVPAGSAAEDPCDWGVDRVVRELCSDDRSWPKPPGLLLPDPVKLAAAIQENQLNGWTLLHCSDLTDHGQFNDLMRDLGVRGTANKAAIAFAINYFRARSKQYQAWKKWRTEQASVGMDVNGDIFMSDAQPLPDPRSNATQSTPPEAPSGDVLSSASDAAISKDVSVKPKRRAALETVDTSVERVERRIPTEADIFTEVPFVEVPRGTLLSVEAGSFLGSAALAAEDILRGPPVLENLVPDIADSISNEPSETFSIAYLPGIPAGRRIQVNRLVRNSLLVGSETFGDGAENNKKRPSQPSQRPTGRIRRQKVDLDEDEVLPLFGESDYDTEVLDELEEDMSDDEVFPSSAPTLSDQEVNAALDEAIHSFVLEWNAKKLPKLKCRAYNLWKQGTKDKARGRLMAKALDNIAALDKRISKIRAEILKQSWTKAKDVLEQAKSLQQSVADRETSKWELGVLRSDHAPDRPSSTQMLAVKRSRRAPRVLSADGGMELTSDSEYGSDVSDSLTRNAVPLLAPPVRPETPPIIDLTGVLDDEPTPRQLVRKQLSALSQTPKEEFKVKVDTPDPIPYTEMAKIYDKGEQFWVNAQDRARLLICLLHPWRSKLWLAAQIQESIGDFISNVFLVRLVQMKDRPVQQSSKDTGWNRAMDVARLIEACMNLTASPLTGHSEALTNARYLAIAQPEVEPENTGLRQCFILLQQILFLWAKYSNNNAITVPDGDLNARIDQAVALYPDKAIEALHITRIVEHEQEAMMGEESDEAEQELPDTLPVTNKATAGGLTMGRLQAAARALQAAEVKRIASQKERAEAFRQKAARGDYGEDIRSGKVLVVNESKDDKDDIITINPGIGSRIFPYQVEGVRFMWDQIVDPKEERGCLLAHTMGLGKTMQVITVLVTIAEAAKSDNPRIIAQIPEKLQLSRTLVMCPSSVVDNWMDELQQWAPGGVLGAVHKIDSGRISGDPATVVEQRKQLIDRWATEGGVLVIGHGLLRAMEGDEAYKSAIEQIVQSASIVVGDEAHEMKTRRTKLFELARRFKTRVRIAMTGSPLANNVDEYFSMIDWIHPGYLSDADDFTRVFRHPIEHGLYADSLPSDRRTAFKILRLLHTMMEPKVHRKTLQAVKDQLPQKREFVIYVPLKETQRKAYDMIIDGFRSEEKRKAGIFAQINPLALLLNHPSLLLQFLAKSNKGREGPIISTELVEELIPILDCKDRENPNLSPKVGMALAILEESKRKGDKVLLFSHSIETLNFLENLLRLRKYNVSRLDGSTPTTSRQDRVKEFNSDRKDVFLISTTAGGVGLNIAGANRVIIMDFRFNPVHEQQAIGRAFRIRQQKDVFVYHFVCEKTFEETLQNKSVFKRQLASRVIDAKNPISYTNRLGDLLLKSEDFKNRKRRGIEKHRGLDSVLDRVLQDFDVRQVIGTETFEEEDADARLTATEEQQVVSFWESDQADARTFMSQETGAVPKAPTSGEPAVPPEFPQTFPTATNGIQNGHGQAATAPGETPAATGRPATVQALQRRQSTTPIPVPVIPPPSAQPQQLKRASSSVLNGHGSGAVEQPSPKIQELAADLARCISMHLESNEHSLGHLTAGLRAINTTIEDATLRASQGINRVAARARSTGGVSAQQLLKAVKRAVKDEVRFMITLILGIIRVEEDISQGPSRIDAIVKALRGLTDEQFKRLLLSRSLDGLATEPTMQAPTADTQSGKHHNHVTDVHGRPNSHETSRANPATEPSQRRDDKIATENPQGRRAKRTRVDRRLSSALEEINQQGQAQTAPRTQSPRVRSTDHPPNSSGQTTNPSH